MHNGDGRTVPPYIYLYEPLFNEPLLPYDSFLDNTILLISISSILIDSAHIWNLFLIIYYSLKTMTFSLFLYHVMKKSQNFFVFFSALR